MQVFGHYFHLKKKLLINKYLTYVEKYDIMKQTILYEAWGAGRNEQRLSWLERKYPHYKIYVVCGSNDCNGIHEKLKKGSRKYLKVLATAQYIINDGCLYDMFIKRDGQCYLKFMAGDTALTNCRCGDLRSYSARNMQRDCLKADYFICGNVAAADSLGNHVLLRNICTGKILIEEQELCLPAVSATESSRGGFAHFIRDDKKNIVFYVSALEQNGLTTSFLNLLAQLDLSRYHYFVLFKTTHEGQEFDRLELLPKNVNLIAMDQLHFTLKESAMKLLYFRVHMKITASGKIRQCLDSAYEREANRLLRQLRVDYFIHYTGYETDVIRCLEKAKANKIIYVHSDMTEEIRIRKYQHYETLRQAYQNYDKVAVVAKGILEHTTAIGGPAGHYYIVNNCHDYAGVRRKADQRLLFDEDTSSTHSLEEISTILDSAHLKFINIGRFSPEKGHFMLIDAFAEFHKNHSDAYLFIIGGRGQLYEKTVKYRSKYLLQKNIIIIKSIRNPMPILKRCDLFLLSSLYEGFGLVLLEAATLHIPIVCTDISGPGEFIKSHGGFLVKPDRYGILKGMEAFIKGEVIPLEVDFKKYNQVCMKQFNRLIEK